MARLSGIAQARLDVLGADGGCIAPVIDPGSGPCRDQWGSSFATRAVLPYLLEVDRIRDDASMGKAPSHEDRTRMVALCPGHHRGTGASAGYIWATSHRAEIRDYRDRRNRRMGWLSE